MKLGLMSAALPQLSLEQLAAWAGENRYQMLELACWPSGRSERRYSGVTHLDVAGLTERRVGEVKDLMSRHQLSISALGYYPNPLHPDPDHRAQVIGHLEKVIVAAGKIGVPIVGTFVGRDKNRNVEENLEEFSRVWPPLVRLAADHGVKIAIENCPMIFSADEWPGGNNLASAPWIWRKMWEIIPDPNFGLNLDPSHLVLQFIDIPRVVREFRHKIFHVHAKDLEMDRDGLFERGVFSLGMGWQRPRLPGLGEVNWAQFISALYEVGYDYVLSVEHEDRAFEGSEEKVKRGFLIARDVLAPYLH